jgi:hypothetical protein
MLFNFPKNSDLKLIYSHYPENPVSITWKGPIPYVLPCMRHLPSYWLLSISSLSLSACNASPSDSTVPVRTRPPAFERELRSVTGSFVSFDISTFMAVSCADYQGRFMNETPFLITDSTKLRAITHRLAALRADTMDSGTDTRAKAVFFYNNQTQDTLCMGRFNCLYRGQSMQADSVLYQLLGISLK